MITPLTLRCLMLESELTVQAWTVHKEIENYRQTSTRDFLLQHLMRCFERFHILIIKVLLLKARRLTQTSCISDTMGSKSEFPFSYFEASSVHCLKYFSNQRSTRIEKFWFYITNQIEWSDTFNSCRIFWMLLMLLSSGVFCFLIARATAKFNSDEIVMELSRKEVSIRDIPFPAIAMCPQIFRDDHLPGFDQELYTPSDDKWEEPLNFYHKLTHNLQWRVLAIHRIASRPAELYLVNLGLPKSRWSNRLVQRKSENFVGL